MVSYDHTYNVTYISPQVLIDVFHSKTGHQSTDKNDKSSLGNAGLNYKPDIKMDTKF